MQADTLPITFDTNNLIQTIYPTVIRTKEDTLLVDCGYEGFLPLIELALSEDGIAPDAITGIIITHHDIDHYGALAEWKAKYPQTAVYASAIEEPFISGKKRSLRLQQAASLFPSLNEDQIPAALAFQKALENIKPATVTYAFHTGQDPFPFKGTQIVQTPGHMPGHISIYVPSTKTFIAGDALVLHEGEPDIANPQYTLDMQAAIETVRKISRFDIDKLICYHGGCISHNVNQKLEALAARLEHSKSGAADIAPGRH